MPRRREVPKRVILPDPKFEDLLVAKFVNNVMVDGKKSTAEQIVYGAFDLVSERTGTIHLKFSRPRWTMFVLFSRSSPAGSVAPLIRCRLSESVRRTALAMRWLVTYAKGRSEKTMRERLAGEFGRI